jgi:hypothetical protein
METVGELGAGIAGGGETGIKGLDFGLHLIDRPGQRVFGLLEPLDGPFGLRGVG